MARQSRALRPWTCQVEQRAERDACSHRTTSRTAQEEEAARRQLFKQHPMSDNTNKQKHTNNHSNEAVRQLQQGNQPLIKLKKSVRRNESKTFISLETWFLLAEILWETLWPLRLGWIRVLLLALEAPFNHRFKGANKNKTKKTKPHLRFLQHHFVWETEEPEQEAASTRMRTKTKKKTVGFLTSFALLDLEKANAISGLTRDALRSGRPPTLAPPARTIKSSIRL